MALFGKKKGEKTANLTSEQSVSGQVINYDQVLRAPHITEKASDGMARGVYVFDVAVDSTKQQIKAAIKRVYKVDPVQIRVARIPRKTTRNMRTGMRGVKGGGKKAYVYLKKGEQISVM